MKVGQISVQYLDHMGDDLTVVNAARASFDKESTWVLDPEHGRVLKPADKNLIQFLARGFRTGEWDELADTLLMAESRHQVQALLRQYKKHAQHWAPFAHPHVSLRLHMPVFAARQYVKHQIGGTWSEVSRRYVSDEPEFWFPNEWHNRPENIKQGSGDAVLNQGRVQQMAERVVNEALYVYRGMLMEGVAPEEARMILPLNHMTTVVWTGSLLFWSRVYNQRADAHAQKAATQEIAQRIGEIMSALFPTSWQELTA